MTDLQCVVLSTIAAFGIVYAVGWLRGRAWEIRMQQHAERHVNNRGLSGEIQGNKCQKEAR